MIDGDDNQYDNNDNNYDDNDNNDGDDDFNDIDLHLQNRGRLGDGRSDESSGESPLVRSSSSSPSPSSSWSSSSAPIYLRYIRIPFQINCRASAARSDIPAIYFFGFTKLSAPRC